ncbi:MAG: L-idonate 5-dehydrogenase [Amaricoccus sp.]
MRAARLYAPHDLRVEKDDPPGAPGPGEVFVRMGAGGICGSDLHYYLHGGFGAVRLKAPMILGHEIAGIVEAVGEGVNDLAPGTVVAVNPSRPCGECAMCRAGLANHCPEMRFLGSAMRDPHVQGGFREAMVVPRSQAVAAGAGVSVAAAAFAEPLAVCLHAVAQAGPLEGRRVLVSGAGPIGVITVAAARRAGAGEIVAADVIDEPLEYARRMGAGTVVNIARDPGALAARPFDVVFEASGAPAAVAAALELVAPRGTVVQIGQAGQAEIPVWRLVSREITLRGTFRFVGEFAEAVAAISDGSIDTTPLLTATLPLAEATAAFELAADKRRAMKVQISFEGADA